MAQFDIYANPLPSARGTAPYVIQVQADLLPSIQTVIVAPLVRKPDPGANAVLQHAVTVDGEPFVILLQAMSAVRTRSLSQPIGRAIDLRDRLMSAVDLIFLGF
ncbi:MAG: hypothetical protein GC189_05260 [Alphaproteobacteria bacterium]|nr:hypothetical protein [Alphaproteobacteria bacterium]